MSEQTSSLTKVEVLWAEIIELASKLDSISVKLVDAEHSVGSTVTSLEESLVALAEQMKTISSSADGVLNAKQEELNKLIELALEDVAAKTAQRDLEVVELISEAVENRIGQLHEVLQKQLSDSVIENSQHIQSESNKHLVRATQAVERASKADKAIYISLATVLILIVTSISGYAGWHLAYLHYANSAKTAERFITSNDGQAAIEFSKLNNVQAMLSCKGYKETKQGSHIYCVPMDSNKNVSGWRIE